jgi:hypothetical protein
VVVWVDVAQVSVVLDGPLRHAGQYRPVTGARAGAAWYTRDC